MEDDAESVITNERYEYVTSVVKKCVQKKRKMGEWTTSDKIDKIITNRILALPIFAVIMFGVYYISMVTIGAAATDWTKDVLFSEMIPPMIQGALESIGCAVWLEGLIVDGIVAGVGAVLGFVPQMLVLFFLLSILEGCGYMVRIAFIMDRIFRRFGMSGKSFIPMLVGTGCGVPGVMASRTIENERDRRMTVMTTTFIPCGAKMPIVGLIAGAVFGGVAWVDHEFRMLEVLEMDHSILAHVGNAVCWIFQPLGWGDWKSTVAAFTGLIAKENVVATFGILYGVEEVAEEGNEIWGSLAANMSQISAYSFLVFNLLCAPCFAAMGAIKREMNSSKWFWRVIGYQCLFAYLTSLCVFQIGTVLMRGSISIGTIAAGVILILFVAALIRPARKGAYFLKKQFAE